jgi:AcrR family transcriptional regulator
VRSTRRDEILAHAAKLFSERGIAATTVRDIADEVGILSGSLYHYFDSKDAIANEIVVRFLEDLNVRYEDSIEPGGSARDRLATMVSVSFASAVDHPYATEVYQGEAILSSQPADAPITILVQKAHSYWRSAIARGIADAEFREDIDPEQFHRLLRESVWSTVAQYRPQLSELADDLQRNLISVFLDGFAARSVDGEPVARIAQPTTKKEAQTVSPASEFAELRSDSQMAELRSDVDELKSVIRELSSSIRQLQKP